MLYQFGLSRETELILYIYWEWERERESGRVRDRDELRVRNWPMPLLGLVSLKSVERAGIQLRVDLQLWVWNPSGQVCRLAVQAGFLLLQPWGEIPLQETSVFDVTAFSWLDTAHPHQGEQSTPQGVFDQDTGHRSRATLTHKINHHGWSRLLLYRENRNHQKTLRTSTWSS